MVLKKKWTWDRDLSRFNEWFAWQTFRNIRWNLSAPRHNPRCIYCKGDTYKISQRKEGNQFFYKCKTCGKGFTDLTETPFHKSRLTMRTALFLTALWMAAIPKKRIADLLGIARTTVIRHAEEIRDSQLCERINQRLKERGITAKRIIEYLTPKAEEQKPVTRPEMPLDKDTLRELRKLTRDDYRGRVFEV
jgi:transposase-like protein